MNIQPNHPMVKSWLFDAEANDYAAQDKALHEAELANAMANVAADNGMSANDLQHLFPAVLRMLKSNSNWAK